MSTAQAVKGPRPYHKASPKPRATVSTFAERFKAVGFALDWRPTDWNEPRYPGDSIMRVDLTRGNEFGDIRIQWYGAGLKPTPEDTLKVGSFTPGYETSSPGDTPKWWPDKDEYVYDRVTASKIFMQFLVAAIRDGWRVKEGR